LIKVQLVQVQFCVERRCISRSRSREELVILFLGTPVVELTTCDEAASLALRLLLALLVSRFLLSFLVFGLVPNPPPKFKLRMSWSCKAAELIVADDGPWWGFVFPRLGRDTLRKLDI